ncbi:hypothetical protein Lpp22_0271 [Lacticaseibacillus paracasei subsp. paracasei Lpp22]|uniref:Uncharacterized protein n=1 Tax=Lacticaseibacillus paracasei subsp. paracasei Lpp22 TaxID=1256221 RepID=A0A8E0M6Q8_LACPA|nr:hypothetical protein Lpp22_0271 [Lacticaseibacillus paracasei subsp. paracasei Lpp22]
MFSRIFAQKKKAEASTIFFIELQLNSFKFCTGHSHSIVTVDYNRCYNGIYASLLFIGGAAAEQQPDYH